MTEQKNSYFHSFLLLLTATIWGVAFVAQSVGMDYIGPATFVASRSVVAVVVLTPLVWLLRRRETVAQPKEKASPSEILRGGAICGALLFGGMLTQQVGIIYTSVGKAGFITTFYVVLVPLLGVVLGRKIGLRIWLAVLLAITGLYFLCMRPGGFSIGLGDAMVLVSACFYTVQITCVDRFVTRIDGVLLSYMEMIACAVLGLLAAFLLETPSWPDILRAALPILYAGGCSSALGYTFQIIGQKGVSPTVAALIMSLESCISAIAGWLILHEVMSAREITGCILMFAAILLSQLPASTWQHLHLRKREHS
ncbi:MAG: DMT family transporter [Peptococcaceae bacterium]|nr:DMT family transporter [Peptococcaceae bacterium]